MFTAFALVVPAGIALTATLADSITRAATVRQVPQARANGPPAAIKTAAGTGYPLIT